MTAMTVETVYEAFAATAEKFPDRPFLNVLPGTADIYDIPPGELTYGAARQEVDTLAQNLMEAGYGAGMRVALLLENRPTFFLHWLAVNRIGGSVVPVNPDLRAAELEYLIGHSEPALIISIEDRHKELEAAIAAAGIKAAVIAPVTRSPGRATRRSPPGRWKVRPARRQSFTPLARPANRRAASFPIPISCLRAAGMPVSADWQR